MFGTNTYAAMESSHSEGYQSGIDSVMIELNELMFDVENLTSEERKVVRKVYNILSKKYPEKP